MSSSSSALISRACSSSGRRRSSGTRLPRACSREWKRIAAEDRARLVGLAFRLLAGAIQEGALDSRTAVVAELGQLLTEKGVDTLVVFNVVYLMERTALDEISANDAFEREVHSWPVVAQMVRRASFDVCSVFTEYLSRDVALAAIIDPLTTLHTRCVFVAALEKEIQRAERYGHPFALVLFDVPPRRDQQHARFRRRRPHHRADRHHHPELFPRHRLGRANGRRSFEHAVSRDGIRRRPDR